MTDGTGRARRLTPPGIHHFFGYYDLPAADAAGRHLVHRVGFRDRFPRPGDAAVLGWTPLPADGAGRDGCAPIHEFGETTAWNFQQGSMLQWLPEPDTCLYNIFEEGRFAACAHNLRTGRRQRLPMAVANVARDGTRALCINMARLYAFRPGYGYEECPDPFAAENAPEADGVFLMDLSTGTVRQILSLAEIAAHLEQAGEPVAGKKLLINHITFNPSASRFLFLLRSFPGRPGSPWATWLLTADATGGGLRLHPVWGMASHYHWRDDDGMLFWANTAAAGEAQLILISDQTGERRPVDRVFFRADGHCSHHPSLDWILYDSYPDASTPDHRRALQLYDVRRSRGLTLGHFRSEQLPPGAGDLRCDLHPRWMPDGRSITFDSIHEGYRAAYWMDLRGMGVERS